MGERPDLALRQADRRRRRRQRRHRGRGDRGVPGRRRRPRPADHRQRRDHRGPAARHRGRPVQHHLEAERGRGRGRRAGGDPAPLGRDAEGRRQAVRHADPAVRPDAGDRRQPEGRDHRQGGRRQADRHRREPLRRALRRGLPQARHHALTRRRGPRRRPPPANPVTEVRRAMMQSAKTQTAKRQTVETQTASDPVRPGELLLSLRGVCKQFGAVSALTGIDLDIHAGEVVALVGDNGAGKSTLVKILSGVHRPTGGTLSFRGREVSLGGPGDALELGIATVFQDLALCENLDVVANIYLGQERNPWRLDEVAMELRAWTLLNELSARIPSVREAVASLSGGQRQTVAIARALLLDPKIILLDEPTAALGVAQTAEVLNLIERVRERGLGVVMISHNMEDVRAVADRIAVLRLGRNNGIFYPDASNQELVGAITGASDNVVTRRAARRAQQDPAQQDTTQGATP
ncbi:ABC-type sugar transport system [Methylobacterium aquaticum]|uniref:ABC-type sugar transport system n=3 Tax=Methylobacteriaceae TaxID=119045 RepID=A0A1Y0Z8X2_9HYPH|nr:ABC-type sugar transport system [Methylobacterium aquaticum]